MINTAVEDHQITVKGLNVWYRTAGDSKSPPVILLNGWGARLNGLAVASDKVIKELARQGFYVYSPEHPGLMRSETPKTAWGFKEYAEYVEKFVEKLNIRRPIIMGQSFGGAVATAYAAEHTDKIKALVLVNAGLSSDKKHEFFLRHRFYGQYFTKILRSRFVPQILKKLLAAAVLGTPWKHVEKESFEERSIMGEIFNRWHLPNLYRQIKVKTIMIWGKNDILFPPSSAEEVEKELPNAKLFIIGGGHGVLYARPKKVVEFMINKLGSGYFQKNVD